MSKEKRSGSAGSKRSRRGKKKAEEQRPVSEPKPAQASEQPAWTDAAEVTRAPLAWSIAAWLPLALSIAAAVWPSIARGLELASAERGVVWWGLGALAAHVAAMLLFVPLAWADAKRSIGESAGWTAGLVLATGLTAPAFQLLRLRAEPLPEQVRASERWLPIARGAGLAVLGFGASFLLMASERQLEQGPLWGILAVLLGLGGLLDASGATRRAEGALSWRETTLFAREGEPLWMSPVVTAPLAIAILAVGAMAGGYDGLPVTIVLALAALTLSALRRPGLLVFVVAGALYLPFLGVYGLWDPWETHYGEVAREMLSRDDWISLWWAQEDWFWSKPILIFWSEALSMGAFGVDYHPDANPAHPEWAIRLPHFLLATGALLSVYALVSRVWSKRAGAVAAMVVATTPHFFFLAHQAITDMPFVSCMTMAMCMLGLAIVEDPSREAKSYAIGPLSFSARHAVIAAISAVVLPQVLYLFSRNVTFMSSLPPFGWHGDLFMSGSAGNHGIPGNTPVHNVEPYLSGPAAQPVAQGLLWLLGYAGILLLLRKERRAQSLYVFAFYLFCGLAFMAKGIPGFALPGLVALLFLIGARRWDLLLEGRLRVASGALVVLVTGLPWYVAMYIRHGPPFTERLLIHDHINRLTAGVHGDTGSIEYFVEQLGYGLFPWIGLVPLALIGFLELRRDPGQGAPEKRRRREVTMLVALWLASAFTLFSAMTTKFHHYIFPAVPAAGILVGIALNRMLEPERAKLDWSVIGGSVLAALAPVPAILGVAGIWGDVRGVVPAELSGEQAAEWALTQPWPSAGSAVAVLFGVLLFAGAVYLLQTKEEDAPRWKPAALTTGLLTAPALVALVGRDLSWVTDARPQGYERLIHLFVYNYGRPWPEHFDYRPILTGFAVVATVVLLLAAARPLRGAATRAYLGVALAFTVWSLDVYMIDLSPHWGQRELVQRYYEERSSAEEPLVAWQMNWKGENFYSGNRVSVFVQLDNRELNDWLRRNTGRTAFFLLEHSRLGSLRSVLRDSAVEEVTDTHLCNKFILVRAHIGRRAPTPAVRDERD